MIVQGDQADGIFSSVHFSHFIPNCVTITSHNYKKYRPSKFKCICFKSDGFLYIYKAADKVCFS